jgi:membrane-associated phospholipid phosphatase
MGTDFLNWRYLNNFKTRFAPRFALQQQLNKLRRFLLARVKPEGFLGLYLSLAIAVLVAASWLFMALAEDVFTRDQITILDNQFSAWLQAHQAAGITALMLFVTRVHSNIWIDFVALIIIVYWWFGRLRHWALTLALSVYGGSLLNYLLKNLFLRARPQFEHPIITSTGYSFPSGHTLAATVFYGALCAFALCYLRSWLSRTLALALCIFMVSLVGFSRIYLGAHYLSDVLAAMLEGLAWLAVCLIGVGATRRRLKSATRT